MNNPKNPITQFLTVIETTDGNPNPNQNHPKRMALCRASFSSSIIRVLVYALYTSDPIAIIMPKRG